MKQVRELDIIVYGATGYTGRLVAEYLNQCYGVNGDIKWAMAGRSLKKLEAVRDELNIASGIPIVLADASDQASIDEMVEKTRIVLTTVGPYSQYGRGLLAACVASGTDYVDLNGEPSWMREMIAHYQSQACETGARIVFSCGFDSVPSDLGVWYLQSLAKEQYGAAMPRVKTRIRTLVGNLSGGTVASLRFSEEEAARTPELRQFISSAFCLTPGFTGPEQPSANQPEYDEDLDNWMAPFFMAFINSKNVHRTNFLLGHAYGKDFTYDEMMMTGPGQQGEEFAQALADTSMASLPIEPGEGPSKEERESGTYDFLLIGEGSEEQSIRVGVKGDRDPGYGSTSKMIAECAVCLLWDAEQTAGGFWTPAAAMGDALIKRLQANAGLTFMQE